MDRGVGTSSPAASRTWRSLQLVVDRLEPPRSWTGAPRSSSRAPRSWTGAPRSWSRAPRWWDWSSLVRGLELLDPSTEALRTPTRALRFAPSRSTSRAACSVSSITYVTMTPENCSPGSAKGVEAGPSSVRGCSLPLRHRTCAAVRLHGGSFRTSSIRERSSRRLVGEGLEILHRRASDVALPEREQQPAPPGDARDPVTPRQARLAPSASCSKATSPRSIEASRSRSSCSGQARQPEGRVGGAVLHEARR